MYPRKKLKSEKQLRLEEEDEKIDLELSQRRANITLSSPEGQQLGSTLDIPLTTNLTELQAIVQHLTKEQQSQLKASEQQEDIPYIYSFFYGSQEIKTSLKDFVKYKLKNFTTEITLPITYHPQSLFYVRPITRQSSSLPGHAESILSAKFSANGSKLASGSGDTTIRFWDINTETPLKTCEGGHKNWVLVIDWSPDNRFLASGGMDGEIAIWDSETCEKIGGNLKGHTKWITSLSWEPLHSCTESKECELLASASKDFTARIWHVPSQKLLVVLSGHTKCITRVLWGGEGHLYTSSEDLSIKCWDKTGKLTKELKGHAHWVNTLCVHTEYALRTGGFDEKTNSFSNKEARYDAALKKYLKAKGEVTAPERLVSGSDDFTLIMWHPARSNKQVARMTGHQQPVNHAQFSPDGRFLISASFDKSLRLWDGHNGNFMAVFRGHVGPVYQIAWSPDSRLLVSGSKDSTMKVWDVKTKKLMFDLPGHADEVYTVDWSPDGQKVVSGGKDRFLKLWKN